jgi:hypothetical protein
MVFLLDRNERSFNWQQLHLLERRPCDPGPAGNLKHVAAAMRVRIMALCHVSFLTTVFVQKQRQQFLKGQLHKFPQVLVFISFRN